MIIIILFGIVGAIVLAGIICLNSSRMEKELLEIDLKKKQINPKLAIAFIIAISLFALQGAWWGYNEIRDLKIAINNQVNTVDFSSRVGFYIFCVAAPIFFLVIPIEKFWPDLVRRHEKFLNQFCIVILITLFAAGFMGSFIIRKSVENAGYVYCHNASGISALARTLVYTKNMDICEELVEMKLKEKERKRN